MIADIDRATVMPIIDLADSASEAGAQRLAASGGPAAWVLSLDDPDMVPTQLSLEERALHDRLAGLDSAALARILAENVASSPTPGPRATCRSKSSSSSHISPRPGSPRFPLCASPTPAMLRETLYPVTERKAC